MKIRTTEIYVKDALENDPRTRTDDYLLIEAVISKMVNTDVSFRSIMQNHNELGLPSLETITRCRRKLQREYPELVDQVTNGYREEKIDDYIQYALDID